MILEPEQTSKPITWEGEQVDKGILTTQEAAQYLSIKEETLRRWAAAKAIPVVRLNRLLRFRRSALDEWLAEREQAVEPPGQ